jgi:alkylated DNA nucleotide flippase Atl1
MEKIHTLRVRLSKFMNPVGEKRITQKAVAEMIGYKQVDIHRFVNNTLKSYKSDMIDKLWELVESETKPDQEDEKIWKTLAEIYQKELIACYKRIGKLEAQLAMKKDSK